MEIYESQKHSGGFLPNKRKKREIAHGTSLFIRKEIQFKLD